MKAARTYNAALVMLIFEYAKTLAGGATNVSVRRPLRPRTVVPAVDSRYKAGYFDNSTTANYVKISHEPPPNLTYA